LSMGIGVMIGNTDRCGYSQSDVSCDERKIFGLDPEANIIFHAGSAGYIVYKVNAICYRDTIIISLQLVLPWDLISTLGNITQQPD